jgi:hypothetical protein
MKWKLEGDGVDWSELSNLYRIATHRNPATFVTPPVSTSARTSM